jgi:multiple sugar transport system substrate-binding protein
VAYLTSHDCRQTVGKRGIIFPAAKPGTDAAVAAYKKVVLM